MAKDIGTTDAPDTDDKAKIRLADHPRARASIARAKAWGAVLGFGLTAWFAYKAGVPFVDLVIRSILIGAAASLTVWAVAQAVWKQILFAEVAAARKRAVEAQKAILDELENPDKIDGAGQ